jgi:hypothetical protein
VLISRGVCSFEEKVRNAQNGEYQTAIIYDDQDKGNLYSSKQSIFFYTGMILFAHWIFSMLCALVKDH